MTITEQEREAAYIAGQNAAFAGSYSNPFDVRDDDERHYAFIDGFEDWTTQSGAIE